MIRPGFCRSLKETGQLLVLAFWHFGTGSGNGNGVECGGAEIMNIGRIRMRARAREAGQPYGGGHCLAPNPRI